MNLPFLRSLLTQLQSSQTWVISIWQLFRSPSLISSFTITALLIILRQLGTLQSLELKTFDWLVRSQPPLAPDSRLLIVTVTEKDIQSQGQWPLTDRVLAQTLATLQRYQPLVIGIDFYRDLPQEPGTQEFLTQLQAKNVIAITKIGNGDTPSIPPPATVPSERVGFNDLVLDPDGVVRRQLLFANTETETWSSFALQLALFYLKTQGIEPKNSDRYPELMQLGHRIFRPLKATDGGYTHIDDRGYQILLNYRCPKIAKTITLQQVLDNQLQPDWVKNKIILIGTAAPSVKDFFFTPYSDMTSEDFKMPGIFIHAQMVSHLLNIVLKSEVINPPIPIFNSRFRLHQQFWFFPDWAEVIWIGTWSVIGGIVVWRLQHPLNQGIAILVAVLSLVTINYVFFSINSWIPLATPTIALILTSATVIAYKQIHNALHDNLTGLPTRTLLLERVGQALKTSKKYQTLCAVLIVNLDRFKLINDSLGFAVGDQLLIAVVKQLKECLRTQDFIARIDVSELTILLENIKERHNAIRVAERIHQCFMSPLYINDRAIYMTTTIGLALSDTAEGRAEYLLRNANTAMHQAQLLGHGRFQVFEQTMHVSRLEKLQLETSLRFAIQNNEFILHYQPLINLKTGKIIGFEALVRWQHPQWGLVTPETFLPAAKETGLIIPIGKWALQEACHQLKIWQGRFSPHHCLTVGVNLSSRQLFQPNLIEEIKQIIQEFTIEAETLKIEIPETVMMDDINSTVGILNQLKSLNLTLSIDNFGTGFSSLSLLPRLPIDTLKIDRSFVSLMEAEENGTNLAIVRTIISLAHALNLTVIAEGVETEQQLIQLRSLGCEYAQGYYFLKPVPADIATAFFESNPQW